MSLSVGRSSSTTSSGRLVDRFSPVLVATEFDAEVVDPRLPDQPLRTADGGAVRYRGRIDLFVVDEHDRYWLVRHRVVDWPWDDLELLVLDDVALAACWAWERFTLTTVTGVIFNELRRAPPDPHQRVAAGLSPRRRADLDRKRGTVAQHRHRPRAKGGEPVKPEQRGNDFFRRTVLPVPRERVDDLARRIGYEALEMMSENVALYPNPVGENCACCPYRRPCLVMNDGAEVAPILAAEFSRRVRPVDEVRLGGLFGLNPNQMRVRQHRPTPTPTPTPRGSG